MSIIPIEVAMQHVYADEADQPQVERKLASAIEAAEQFIGRRIYSTVEELNAARVAAAAQLSSVIQITSVPVPTPEGEVLQLIEESNQAAKYELTMQIRGIVVNPALEIGILLILGDLYANRENTTDKTANELPMGAKHHLQPFRVDMGV